jgi:hypothetical protein
MMIAVVKDWLEIITMTLAMPYLIYRVCLIEKHIRPEKKK